MTICIEILGTEPLSPEIVKPEIVPGANLVIHNSLGIMALKRMGSDSGIHDIVGLFHERSLLEIDGYLDAPLSHVGEGDVSCMLIRYGEAEFLGEKFTWRYPFAEGSQRYRGFEGLVLRPVPSQTDHYRRVGMFSGIVYENLTLLSEFERRTIVLT